MDRRQFLSVTAAAAVAPSLPLVTAGVEVQGRVWSMIIDGKRVNFNGDLKITPSRETNHIGGK